MATVYSLVCWGGKDGKTVTMTIASPCVVSLANHGLRDGTGVVFSTTGALPTGITAGTTYYSRSTATGTFNLYDTAAHAIAGGSTGIVNTSGSQSGTHTAKGAYYLGLVDKSRWTTDSVERIYASVYAWTTARKAVLDAAPTLDDEVCEVGEAFTEVHTNTVVLSLSCKTQTVTSNVDGVRSSAWHGGILGKGYVLQASASPAMQFNEYSRVVDGISVNIGNTAGRIGIVIGTLSHGAAVKNCIIYSDSPGTGQKGITDSVGSTISNNIICNIGGTGVYVTVGQGSLVHNNIVCKCTIGFDAPTTSQGLFYNNIAVGNGTNWGAWPAYAVTKSVCNIGELTDVATITTDYAGGAPTYITFSTKHNRLVNQPIMFSTTGTLPTVSGVPLSTTTIYYVKAKVDSTRLTITTTVGGTALTFDGNGTGTHTSTLVWSTNGAEKYVDMATPGNVFMDYANNDFRAAASGYTPNAAAKQVNGGYAVSDGVTVDMFGAVRPNYESATYPDNLWDAGPFEFDHGEGLAPSAVNIAITGMASGSEIAIYKASDMSVILAPQSTTGSYSGTYTYTGDTNIIVRVRKGTAATRYLPYEYAGTITSTGFQLVVSQIPDTIAQ